MEEWVVGAVPRIASGSVQGVRATVGCGDC